MIVPQYWAEARREKYVQSRKVVVRRFGWSDASQEEAQANAEARVDAALERIEGGDASVARREPKVAYNGAEGVPIREEILSRHGDAVVTRNSYGAHCLNTPDVLFADVDFEREVGCGLALLVAVVMITASLWIGLALEEWLLGLTLAIVSFAAAYGVATVIRRMWIRLTGGPERRARRRLAKFVAKHPNWSLRLYRTPAGFRVLAVHDTFDPRGDETQSFFRALEVDPVYARMCRHQNCFRARVSPKPWRIGIQSHMKPRPGVWPINPERLPERNRWIAQYESRAAGYASCRFVETLGSLATDSRAEAVRRIHDSMCRADSGLEIA